jgi:hypothetical protein
LYIQLNRINLLSRMRAQLIKCKLGEMCTWNNMCISQLVHYLTHSLNVKSRKFGCSDFSLKKSDGLDTIRWSGLLFNNILFFFTARDETLALDESFICGCKQFSLCKCQSFFAMIHRICKLTLITEAYPLSSQLANQSIYPTNQF